jgi:hypothetical protein
VWPSIVIAVQQPPMPNLDALVAPNRWGARGSAVCKGTGHLFASVANRIQSCSICRTSGVIFTRFFVHSRRAYCKDKNRLLAPYSDGAELRNVPRSCWYLHLDVLLLQSVASSNVCSCCNLAGGKCRFIVLVSRSQPRIRLVEEKVASPI